MSPYLRPIAVVFANPRLRRLQLAWAASMIGTCAYLVALAVVAFRSGGAAAVGLITLARMIAAAAASAPLATLADRYSRRVVMAASDLVRAALFAAIALLTTAGAPTIAVYGLAVAISVVATPFRPAQAALTPALAATPEELTASNAVAGTIESASIFLGPGIGGIVLAASGATGVFVVCLAACLWSSRLVWTIAETPAGDGEPTGGGEAPGGMLAGVRALAAAPALIAVTLTYAAQAMVAGALTVFAVVLAIDVLHLGNAGVGYLDCAFGVGGVLGGVAAVGLAGARRLAAAFGAGVLAWGVGVALLGATTSTAVALALLAGIGIGNTVVDVAAVTLLQRSADDAVLGRVFGILESVLLTALGIGSILAPLAIRALGVRPALAVTGLLLPVVVIASARTLVALDRPDPAVAERTQLLRAHPIFRPLSEATLEQLARRLEPAGCAAGAEVIRQGDPGDRVYIVASGELAVSVDGRAGEALGPGEVFGEIALLRDVPRTAAVRALTDCALYTLGRDEFLAAVTGHPHSAAQADVVVATRLAALRPGVVKA
ncbi:MAG TPA: MFS transporter [Gaiellales bacterium]|nr:MFS transporter [Gaiellales bacterium]